MGKDYFYMNNKSTLTLEHIMTLCHDYDEFEKYCSEDMLNDDCKIGHYLFELLIKYNKKAHIVSTDAYLASGYVGNIINHKRTRPSRDVLIRICLTLNTTVEETQKLLRYAGHSPLYVRRKRDVMIWFGLMKGQSLDEVNDNIIKRGLHPLYKE